MKKPAALLAALCALAGCTASLTPAAMALHDSPPERMTSCAYLGIVTGLTAYGGTMLSGVGDSDARRDALNQAADLGATDVVQVADSPRTVRAYKCARPTTAAR